MGFGLLFVGYVLAFAFSIANIYFFADVIGALIMTCALVKLYLHGKKFGVAAVFSALIALVGIGMVTLSFFGLSDSLPVLQSVLEYVKIAAVLAFHVFLLLAVCDIAAYTAIPELRLKAKRNLIIGLIYMTLNFILNLPFDAITALLPYAYFPVLLYGYVWIIMNAALIYRCYMWICIEGDEDMEIKQSKFDAVNKVRDKFNAIEDKVFIRRKTETPAPEQPRKKKKKKQ